MLKLGMEAKLYRNTGTHAAPVWAEVGNVKDVTLSLEKGEADVTVRANAGWRAKVGTLKEGTVEFEMIWDTADAAFQAMKNAFFSDAALEMAVMDGPIAQSGSQGLRAAFSIIKFDRKEPLEEAITVSVSMSPTYADFAPEWMVVP